MCKMESAIDGSLDLYHFALMNDQLDVSAENARRWREWQKMNPEK